MQPITVLFFGSQGAGKNTQVEMLIKHLKKGSPRGIIYIDMGAELRTMIAEGGYTAPFVHEVLNAGRRMPDFMPTYLQTKKLVENFTGEEHVIADGLARGPDQTRAWDDAMKFYGREHYQIISLEISEETSIKRVLARGRHDDTEDAIRNRLAWHKKEVEPQLQFLAERGRTIHHIDGEADSESIHKIILSDLKLA